MRHYTADDGRSFEFDDQVLQASRLLWSKARVVNVAEKAGHDHGLAMPRSETAPDETASLNNLAPVLP
jgi:hypothetical protein